MTLSKNGVRSIVHTSVDPVVVNEFAIIPYAHALFYPILVFSEYLDDSLSTIMSLGFFFLLTNWSRHLRKDGQTDGGAS